MQFTKDIREYMDRSVLCWLATASDEGIPNVSPKEIFVAYSLDEIIIANIASPKTVKNIKQNPNVCVSFIDIFVQKGFQIKGRAKLIGKADLGFMEREKELLKMTEGNFPFNSIISITMEQAKWIIAPRYLLYPKTTEEQQIESSKKTYGF